MRQLRFGEWNWLCYTFFTEKGMRPIKLCQESEEARRGDNDERATAKRHCFPFKEFTKLQLLGLEIN
jgi:hypothetical protein